MLLLNRSPLLEDLSTEALAALRGHPAMSGQWGKDIYGLHRAVAALGHEDGQLAGRAAGQAGDDDVVAEHVEHSGDVGAFAADLLGDLVHVVAAVPVGWW